MKQIKPFIKGIFFIILLVVSDLIFLYLYHERSYERLERCYERHDQTASSVDICGTLNSTANLVYSSATAGHILTYLVIFTLFGLLVS